MTISEFDDPSIFELVETKTLNDFIAKGEQDPLAHIYKKLTTNEYFQVLKDSYQYRKTAPNETVYSEWINLDDSPNQ